MKFPLVTFLLFFATCCFAQTGTISGNDVVRGGNIYTYDVSWTNWDETYDEYSTVSWTVSRGTILSSTNFSVTVQWETWVGEEDGYGYIWVNESWGAQSGFYEVLVNNYPQGFTALCDQVLGPPVVAVNFGSGSNPGPALAPGRTTYNYSASCVLTPNNYTVVTNTNSCRGLWWNIPEDHTPGDVNGYMLMVDGNDTRSEVYRTTVTGLTPGRSYEFSAWVGNLYKTGSATNPELTFEIYNQSGVRLGTSGTIAVWYTSPFTWQQIGFKFDIPPGTTSVDIVVVDQQRASGGNDFVIDDISFAPCYPPIVASFSANPTLTYKAYACSNGTVSLNSWWPLANPFTNPVYQWQRSTDNGATWAAIAGANSLIASRTENTPGIYMYRMYAYESGNPSLNKTSNTLTYYVQTMVVEAKTFDIYGCTGTATKQLQAVASLQFADPSITQNYTYSWSPGTNLNSTTISNPTFSTTIAVPPPNGPAPTPVNYLYTLTVTNTNYGCSASNTQTVTVRAPRKVFVPNAFTPNGDGNNDLWRPINIQDYPGAKLEIFNGWGQRVFFKENGTTLLEYSWDGNFNGIPQATDQFVWQVWLPGCPTNISAAQEGEGATSGTLHLIR